MKRMILSLIITVAVSLTACKKCAEPDNSLFGTWKITEQLADPGDGSGRWTTANDKSIYINFKSDSTYQSNLQNISSYNRFSVSNDRITFYSSGVANPVIFGYSLVAGTLEMRMNCIEACGVRFRKD